MVNAVEEREVVYVKVASYVCDGTELPALGIEKAKEALGWKEEGKEGSNVKYGKNDVLLTYKDASGKVVKVKCEHNRNNRRLSMGNVSTLKQEILRGRYELNGEPIIIGRYGTLLDGQHTLTALILAHYEWEKDPGLYPHWKMAPSIKKVIIYGISEEDKVINTIDTGRPRTLSDVIYRSPYFSGLSLQAKNTCSGIAANAIKLLWTRTGENLDGFCAVRTHAESIDFLDRHPRILECVSLIYESAENLGNPLPGLGVCAGLLYLMGAAKTNPREYLNEEHLVETNVNWELWDQAQDFWVLLADKSNPKFKPIRRVLAQTIEDGDSSPDAKIAIIVKAWELYRLGKAVTEAGLNLTYIEEKNGSIRLNETPVIGGIDIGRLDLIDEEELTKTPPKQEETQKAIREKKATAGELPPSKQPKKEREKGPKNQLVGKARWVKSPEGNWRGKVLDTDGTLASVRILQGFQGAGNTVQVPVSELLEAQPV